MRKILYINTSVSKDKVLKSMLTLLVGKELGSLKFDPDKVDKLLLECKGKFEQMKYEILKRDFTKVKDFKGKPKHFIKFATYVYTDKGVK